MTASLRKFYDSDSLKDANGRAQKNEILKKLGRCLIPAIYTEGNRFDFDLCLPKGPLPLFYSTSRQDPPPAGSDEYFETMVEIKRSENQLIDYLKQARELIGD